LRPVAQMERRLEEAMRLGFGSAVIPERQASRSTVVKTIAASTLRDAIERCLPKAKG